MLESCFSLFTVAFKNICVSECLFIYFFTLCIRIKIVTRKSNIEHMGSHMSVLCMKWKRKVFVTCVASNNAGQCSMKFLIAPHIGFLACEERMSWPFSLQSPGNYPFLSLYTRGPLFPSPNFHLFLLEDVEVGYLLQPYLTFLAGACSSAGFLLL